MTTFVTSFFDLNNFEDRREDKNTDFYVKNGLKLLTQPFNFVVFTDEKTKETLSKMIENKPNIKMITMNFEDLPVCKILDKNIVTLPGGRNHQKDTYNYMAIMISKTFFIEKAIELDPYNTSHFTWIDFGILYLCSDAMLELVPDILGRINNFLEDPKISIPGCTHPHVFGDGLSIQEHLSSYPVWWFCGGFFHGSKEFLLEFSKAMYEVLDVMKSQNIITWEVNIWVYIYNKYPGLFRWYCADHGMGMLTSVF
jgi:hypothetical protein